MFLVGFSFLVVSLAMWGFRDDVSGALPLAMLVLTFVGVMWDLYKDELLARLDCWKPLPNIDIGGRSIIDLGEINFQISGSSPFRIANEREQVIADRQAAYGNFADTARVIHDLKIVCQAHWPMHQRTAAQCYAIDMLLTKIGRMINGDPDRVDGWRDIELYAKHVADLQAADAPGHARVIPNNIPTTRAAALHMGLHLIPANKRSPLEQLIVDCIHESTSNDDWRSTVDAMIEGACMDTPCAT